MGTWVKEENETMQIKIAELESQNLDLNETKSIAENDKQELEKRIASLTSECDTNKADMTKKIRELQVSKDEMLKSRASDKMEFDQIKCSMQASNDISTNQLREIKDAE